MLISHSGKVMPTVGGSVGIGTDSPGGVIVAEQALMREFIYDHPEILEQFQAYLAWKILQQ